MIELHNVIDLGIITLVLTLFLLFSAFKLTTDWVLQSCPAIVRSSLNESLLMTSTLHVSDLPRAYIRPLNGRFVPTFTTILVSLQCTVTKQRKKI